MVVVSVLPNGQAPKGLSVGDFVNTAGGMYQIAPAGAYGATYNPASGYWSYNTNNDDFRLISLMNSAQDAAKQNSLQSQDFAREQMAFQNTSASNAMSFSAQQAQLNRSWQERMSNTAHQREVQDLIAAGLNPILSANSSGATTPSGASASGIASSGAAGSVDTSATNALINLFSTALTTDASLKIAEIQSLASMYASDQSYRGTVWSGTNQFNMQTAQNTFNEYMQKTYPTTNNLLGTILSSFAPVITKMVTGENVSAGDYEAMANAWYDMFDDKSKSYKAGLLDLFGEAAKKRVYAHDKNAYDKLIEEFTRNYKHYTAQNAGARYK